MAVFIFGRSGSPLLFSETFSENSWADIIKACQMNKVPDAWKIGDYKTMAIGGTEYVVVIIGKGHDSYSDGTGKAPLTLQLRDCYATDYKMNSSHTTTGGWGSCQMRKTHLPAVLSVMPGEVKEGIREVNKLTVSSGVVKTTADKLFLLSEIEIFGVLSSAAPGEGTRYAYFANGFGTVKYKNGTADAWWARSPWENNGDTFVIVNTDGTPGGNGAGYLSAVSFAFCF